MSGVTTVDEPGSENEVPGTGDRVSSTGDVVSETVVSCVKHSSDENPDCKIKDNVNIPFSLVYRNSLSRTLDALLTYD